MKITVFRIEKEKVENNGKIETKTKTFVANISSESTGCLGIRSEVLKVLADLYDTVGFSRISIFPNSYYSYDPDKIFEFKEDTSVCREGLTVGKLCLDEDTLSNLAEGYYAIIQGNKWGRINRIEVEIERKENGKLISYVSVEFEE